jgi:hypothetical protein
MPGARRFFRPVEEHLASLDTEHCLQGISAILICSGTTGGHTPPEADGKLPVAVQHAALFTKLHQAGPHVFLLVHPSL